MNMFIFLHTNCKLSVVQFFSKMLADSREVTQHYFIVKNHELAFVYFSGLYLTRVYFTSLGFFFGGVVFFGFVLQ